MAACGLRVDLSFESGVHANQGLHTSPLRLLALHIHLRTYVLVMGGHNFYSEISVRDTTSYKTIPPCFRVLIVDSGYSTFQRRRGSRNLRLASRGRSSISTYLFRLYFQLVSETYDEIGRLITVFGVFGF